MGLQKEDVYELLHVFGVRLLYRNGHGTVRRIASLKSILIGKIKILKRFCLFPFLLVCHLRKQVSARLVV